MGNPPYLGKSLQNAEQREDMEKLVGDIRKYKLLDYIFGWFWKAKQYIETSHGSFAFVTTN